MTRNTKGFVVALLAILVATALSASMASATSFTASSYPTTISGGQNEAEPIKWNIDGYETRCQTLEFSGELKEKTSTLTLQGFTWGCTFGGLNTTIVMNGCDYRLHLPAEGSLATMELACPAGKSITVSPGSGACSVHILPFSTKAHLAASNGGGGTVKLAFTVGGISVSLTDASPLFCPFTGNTTVENATYTGNATLSGSSAIDIG